MTDRFDTVVGRFRLLSQTKAPKSAGVSAKRLKPVRVIEEGPVRTVVETLYGYNDSFLILTWKIPEKIGREVKLKRAIFWNERTRCWRARSLPHSTKPSMWEMWHTDTRCCPLLHLEVVQKWTAVVSASDKTALRVREERQHLRFFVCEGRGARRAILRSPGLYRPPGPRLADGTGYDGPASIRARTCSPFR